MSDGAKFAVSNPLHLDAELPGLGQYASEGYSYPVKVTWHAEDFKRTAIMVAGCAIRLDERQVDWLIEVLTEMKRHR